jgi:pyruvate dehydrogenase E1 component
LADDGVIGRENVSEAISRYGINVDKENPVAA